MRQRLEAVSAATRDRSARARGSRASASARRADRPVRWRCIPAGFAALDPAVLASRRPAIWRSGCSARRRRCDRRRRAIRRGASGWRGCARACWPARIGARTLGGCRFVRGAGVSWCCASWPPASAPVRLEPGASCRLGPAFRRDLPRQRQPDAAHARLSRAERRRRSRPALRHRAAACRASFIRSCPRSGTRTGSPRCRISGYRRAGIGGCCHAFCFARQAR